MLNANYAKVLNNFGPGINVSPPKTFYLLKIMVHISPPAAFSVRGPRQRGAVVLGGVPGPWGAGLLAHIPGQYSAPTAARFSPCNPRKGWVTSF